MEIQNLLLVEKAETVPLRFVPQLAAVRDRGSSSGLKFWMKLYKAYNG